MQTISLPVSIGFNSPTCLIGRTTEENEFILTAGCRALDILISSSTRYSDTTLVEKFENERIQSETLLKADYDQRLSKLSKQLAMSQASAEIAKASLTQANLEIDKVVSDARKRVYEETSSRISVLLDENKCLKKEQAEIQATFSTKISELARQAQLREDKLREENQKQLKEFTAANRQRMDELSMTIQSLQVHNANSSLKGNANEIMMTEILTHAFGGDFIDYVRKPNACDHRLRWNGYKIMVEDKAYSNIIPAKEISKALKDFSLLKDYDVLIFIGNGIIHGHTKPGHFDIDIYDGRPIIYIGQFNTQENKVLYLQTLHPVIMNLISLCRKGEESQTNIHTQLLHKVDHIRLLVEHHQKQVAIVCNSANKYFRTLQSGFEEHKLELKKLQDSHSNIVSQFIGVSNGVPKNNDTKTFTKSKLNKMNLEELKQLCAENSISITPKIKRTLIIELILSTNDV